MSTVCPLGLCRTEEDCPNAPCTDCMRRLGEHMIEEVRLMQRQALIAKAHGNVPAMDALRGLLKSLGLAVTMQEMTSSANDPAKYTPTPVEVQAALHTAR